MRVVILAAVIGLVMVGCGSHKPTPPTLPAIVGAWQSPDAEKQFVFNSDNTFSSFSSGQYALHTEGRWQISGDRVSLTGVTSSALGQDTTKTDLSLGKPEDYIYKVSEDGRALEVSFATDSSAGQGDSGSLGRIGFFSTNQNGPGPWIYRRM